MSRYIGEEINERTHERDRYDRDRVPRDHKDYSKDVAKLRERLSKGLAKARKSEESSSFSSKKTEKREEMTAEEQLARTKAIEQIEEGGFQPAAYRTGTHVKKDQKSKKETSHDAAIFGPAWKSAEQRKAIEKKEADVSNISIPTAPPPPMNAMAPMCPSHMNSEHSETRQAAWKSYWAELRQEFSQQNS